MGMQKSKNGAKPQRLSVPKYLLLAQRDHPRSVWPSSKQSAFVPQPGQVGWEQLAEHEQTWADRLQAVETVAGYSVLPSPI